jgi:hypothetical protein
VTERRAEYGLLREAEIRTEYAVLPRVHLHTAQQIAQHLLDAMPSTPAPPTKPSLSTIDVSIIGHHAYEMPHAFAFVHSYSLWPPNTHAQPHTLPPHHTLAHAHVCVLHWLMS